MKKRHETIGAENIIDFDIRINTFLAKIGHYKIINIKYIQDNNPDCLCTYKAFIIYQI